MCCYVITTDYSNGSLVANTFIAAGLKLLLQFTTKIK